MKNCILIQLKTIIIIYIKIIINQIIYIFFIFIKLLYNEITKFKKKYLIYNTKKKAQRQPAFATNPSLTHPYIITKLFFVLQNTYQVILTKKKKINNNNLHQIISYKIYLYRSYSLSEITS